jgi:hypothetical protein
MNSDDAERHPRDLEIARDYPALAPDLRRAFELSRLSEQPYINTDALLAAVDPEFEAAYARA